MMRSVVRLRQWAIHFLAVVINFIALCLGLVPLKSLVLHNESGYFGQDAPSEKDPSYFKARSLGLESFTKNLAVVAAS